MKYKIIFELPAENDLLEILNYIQNVLLEPNTAQKLYLNIRNEINTLEEMPYRYSVIPEKPYDSMGMRRISINNYSAFYLTNEKNHTVHILRILYNRREWQNLI